jgi:hypothetical protein
MRVRVRVISNEVFAGGLILPLGYCSAHVVLPCTAMVCVKLDTFKRYPELGPEAHFVVKVYARTEAALSALLQFASAPLKIEKFQKGLHVRRVYHPH